MRILIADDDPVSLRLLERQLTTLGHEVETAASGPDAWRALQRSRHRLLISDCMMPELSGIELVRRLRNRARGPYVYVILLTAGGEREDQLLAMAAGADDFMRKPVDRELLAARLGTAERLLGLARRRRAPGTRA